MTKYDFNSQLDQDYFESSLFYIADFLFGYDVGKKKLYLEIMNKYLLNVKTYQPYVKNGVVTPEIPGLTRCYRDGICSIHMYGFLNNYKDDPNFNFTVHEFIHECLHASINILNLINKKYQDKIIEGEKVQCSAISGQICYAFEGGRMEVVGKMLNELLVDMLTSVIVNRYDSNIGNKDITIAETLKNPYTRRCNVKTGYTRLVIFSQLFNAAFSLESFNTLANVVDRGESILNRFYSKDIYTPTGAKVKETMYPNLFLDAIILDPLSMQDEFDKFMGEGSYYTLLKIMDYHFENYVYNGKIDDSFKQDIVRIMKIISVFMNSRINYYSAKGLLRSNTAAEAVSEYNYIWNNIQRIYGIVLTQADIEDIYQMSENQIAVNKKKLHY